MKDKTLKNISLCCFIALVFCVAWAGFIVKYLIVDIMGKGSFVHPIDWSVNTTIRIIILSCYVLGSVSMIGLCITSIINTFKGVRENTVFPKSNVKLMFWIALADFIYLLGYLNLSILWKEDVAVQFQPSVFIIPFFLLFFAFMYKVAADAVEENNLTI